MKKSVLIFVILGLMIPWAYAQTSQTVSVANATQNLVVINGISIKSRAVKEVALPVQDGQTTFEAVYYEGLDKKGPIQITRNVEKGRVIIKDFSASEKARTKTTASSEEIATVKTTINPDLSNNQASLNSGEWWSYVTVSPKNSLKDFRIFVPAEPFKGLALRPGQKSAKTVSLRTGKIVFPVYLATEGDSASNLEVRYSWGMVDKIITEGETNFEFRAEDIMRANSGDIIKKVVVSKLPFDFMIAEGKSKGEVIAAGYPKKLELYVGWNILPIQYKDKNGLPTQAVLILLVNDLKRPLMARSKTNVDQISVDRDNVVITNMSR